MKAMIACGSPFDELRFVGPFDNENEAARWAEIELDDVPNWWVVEPDVCNGSTHVVVVSLDDNGLMVRAICDDPQNAGEYVTDSPYKNRRYWTQRVERP